MEMEARSLPADAGRQMTLKVKEYKADLVSLKEQLRAITAGGGSATDAARAELVRRIPAAAGRKQ